MAPRVSVITVCFNAARTIERTILSVFAQTCCEIEYIIVDGGSTDGTLDIIRHHEMRIARWSSERDNGIADAFNKGLALATGEYVAFINADDWFAPDTIACAVDCLDASRDKAFVYGDLVVCENGRPKFMRKGMPDYLHLLRFSVGALNHPTMICRRSVFSAVGGFDTSFRIAVDYEWMLRLHERGYSGLYSDRIRGYMELGGASDVGVFAALRENRIAAIGHGMGRLSSWRYYLIACAKARTRTVLEKFMPAAVVLRLRERLFGSLKVIDPDTAPMPPGAKSAPRRILIRTLHFIVGFGGTPEAILQLARALHRRGTLVDVIAREGFFSDAGALAELPRDRLGAGSPAPMAAYSGAMIVGSWIPEALSTASAAWRAGIPLVYAPKGNLCRHEFQRLRDLKKRIYLPLIEIWVALAATYIHFTSQLERDETVLPHGVKTRKALIGPEAFDPASAVVPRQRPPWPIRFGFIAQITRNKGMRELVDGFLDWLETHGDADVELVVAGTPRPSFRSEYAATVAHVSQHPQGHRIRFMGQVSGEERRRFYQEVHAVMLPSRFEFIRPRGPGGTCAGVRRDRCAQDRRFGVDRRSRNGPHHAGGVAPCRSRRDRHIRPGVAADRLRCW